MHRLFRIAFLGIAILCIPRICPTAILRGFPGLDELIEKADAIIVADVHHSVREILMEDSRKRGVYDPALGSAHGSFEDYEIEVLKSLKGPLVEKEKLFVGVRHFDNRETETVESQSKLYIFFLQPHEPQPGNGYMGDVSNYRVEDCGGSTFKLHPGMRDRLEFDPTVTELRNRIVAIVDKSVELFQDPKMKSAELRRRDGFLSKMDPATGRPIYFAWPVNPY